MVSDQIGDFIIQLKNAGNVGLESICVPYSEFKFSVAEKLKDKNFVKSVSKKGKKIKKFLEVELEYKDDKKRKPRIVDVARVSKPRKNIQKDRRTIPSKIW